MENVCGTLTVRVTAAFEGDVETMPIEMTAYAANENKRTDKTNNAVLVIVGLMVVSKDD